MTVASPPIDDAHRRLAATELGRNVVVTAGAGTGKTRLLINRLTLMILGEEIPVEKIVALTFTKKAAEEMRDRLEKRLREIIADPHSFDLLNEGFPANADRRAALASRALDDIPKAQIGTIHSFAGYLLRLYPVQAGVDPAFREDDGTLFETTFEREWHAWLAEELGEDSKKGKAWGELLSRMELADLKLVARALSALDDISEVPGGAAPVGPFVAQTLAPLDAAIERNGLPAKARTWTPRVEATRRVLVKIARGEAPTPVDVADVAALKGQKAPKEWLEDTDGVAAVKAAQRRAAALCAVDEELIARVIGALSPFAARLRAQLSKRGTLSFDDLLVKARDLVWGHKKVRAAVKLQYAAFLVDEFQDTDPLQGEILFYLAEEIGREADHWRDARMGQGRLFVVGDPKQSIYRFRGADIAAFEEFWRRLVDQGALEAALSENFRSHSHILETVNGLFPSIMRQETFLQPEYQALSPGRAAGAGGCEVVTISIPEGEAANAEALRAFEGRTVAEWITKNVGKDVNGQPLKFGDVAILLRGTSAFQPYLDALRERGIPFLAEGEKTYYHRPEVLEFTNLLAVIAEPSDALALAGVLRSPIGGLTDAEIAGLAASGGLNLRKRPRGLAPAVARLYDRISDLSALAHAVPVPDLIQKVFDSTWLLELAAARRHGEQAVANLRKIAQLAERWLETEPMTLIAFVRRLRLYREDRKDEGENPLADVQYDAVRVMTIHKAKGLEFPVVFLPNLAAEAAAASIEREIFRMDWRTGRVGVFLPGRKATNAARVLIDEDVERREDAEEVRVFYVAMTRARDRLIVFLRNGGRRGGVFSGFVEAAAGKPEANCAHLNFGGARAPVTWVAWERRGPPTAIPAEKGFTEGWSLSALSAAVLRRRQERSTLRKARLFLTPTANLAADHARQEPEKRKLVIDDETDLDRTPPILIGHICHAILEGWDFSAAAGTAGKRLMPAVTACAARFGLLPENPDYIAVVGEVEEIMTGFLASPAFAHLAANRIEGREVPFFYPLGTGDSARLMRGVMDVVYSDGDLLVVGDYKTNRVDELTIDAVAESYRAQGAAYLNAMSKATGRTAEFELIFLRLGRRVRLKV